MCRKSIALGILPHTNAGILTFEEMERLRAVNASMGLMLETTAKIPRMCIKGRNRKSGLA